MIGLHREVLDGDQERLSPRAYRTALLADPCSYCGRAPAATVDHIVPRSRGGTDGPSNWTASCEPDNVMKGSWSLLAHLLHRAGPR